MKKAISAVIMAVLGCAVILLWRDYRNTAPVLEDIYTLDLTKYETTYPLQEFKLKPHDRQWTLKSFTVYDENGEVEWEEIYQLDEDGQSYYIAPNGNRIDSFRMPCEGFQNITGFMTEGDIWDINQEDFDAAGRIIYRDASELKMPSFSEMARWYYRPDEPLSSNDNAVCTFVRTSQIVLSPGEDSWMFDGRMESTAYEIDTYDKYGNETAIWIEDDCYLKTDADGYLQMFVVLGPLYYIERVDEYGRPTWQARYDKNGELMGWSVWEYEDLH